MKKICCALLLLGCLQAKAQNLAPNASFEEYVNCPAYSFDLIPYLSQPAVSVSDWTKPTLGSSDYFNACYTTPNPGFKVPNNLMGHQEARTGNGYAGTLCYSSKTPYVREYLQARLNSPLIAGHHYYARYWISLGEWARNVIQSAVSGIDRMGARFGTRPEERATADPLSDLVPQVESPAGRLFTDTLSWMEVSGTFTAAGNEAWMILGSFTAVDSMHIRNVVPYNGTEMAYYYYDDVCVLDLDGAATGGSMQERQLCIPGSLDLEGRNGAAAYYWDNGSIAASRSVTTPGTYWVKSVDPSTCSIYADTFHITATEIPLPRLGNDTVLCPNSSLTLDAGNTAYLSYHWNTGATASSIVADTPGTYIVTVVTECFTTSDSITISAVPEPEVHLPGDKVLCNNTPLRLYLGQDGMSYAWSTGSAACCIEIKDSGTYTVTATNVCGVSATGSIHVSYSPCGNCVLVPNAFSPNGDGLNDEYQIMVRCMMKSYLLEIYNRYGQEVFRSETPGQGWDGRIGGSPATNDVYFYHLHATPAVNDQPAIERKGDITLIR